jgi:hypothetical protein
MVNKMYKTAISAAAMVLAASSASAATLDFTSGVLSGSDTVLTMPEAMVTAASGTTLSVGDFIANAVCPASTALGGCVGAMTLTWNFDVENVGFDYGFGNAGDFATVTAFDASNNSVGSVSLTLTSGTSSEDLSGLGVFRSLEFDNIGATGAGYAYGNVTFDRAAVIPLPASLPLLLGAFGGLALMRRKRAA